MNLAHEGRALRVAARYPETSTMATYREDMRRTWDRIDFVPQQRLQTRFGTIEYADQAKVCHCW